MKRFLYKLVIFLLIAYIPSFIYIEYFSMNFFNIEYPMWKYQKDFIHNDSGNDDPSILIMGDSRTMAGVVPTIISDEARSLCVGGSSPVETYYMLEDYLKHHKPPQAIFASFGPFHFEKNSFFWERTIKFKLLSLWEEMEIVKTSEELNDHIIVGKGSVYKLYLKTLLYRSNFIYYYLPDLRDGKILSRRSDNLKKYAQMGELKGFTSFGTKAYSDGSGFELEREKFEASPLITSYMEKFLTLCQENNIRLVFETLPVNEATYSCLKKGYADDYINYLRVFKSKYTDLTISDAYYPIPNSNFGDPNHLNQEGAEKYSRYLKDKFFSK